MRTSLRKREVSDALSSGSRSVASLSLVVWTSYSRERADWVFRFSAAAAAGQKRRVYGCPLSCRWSLFRASAEIALHALPGRPTTVYPVHRGLAERTRPNDTLASPRCIDLRAHTPDQLTGSCVDQPPAHASRALQPSTRPTRACLHKQ